jgi:hypothetical protein
MVYKYLISVKYCCERIAAGRSLNGIEEANSSIPMISPTESRLHGFSVGVFLFLMRQMIPNIY